MTDSIQKFGETYLNLSHIRQITFEERAGGESLVCIVNWSDGTGDRFRGETAKALLTYLDPQINLPETTCQIVLTLALDAKEQKWVVGGTDGIASVMSPGFLEPEEVLPCAVPVLKHFLKKYSEKS